MESASHPPLPLPVHRGPPCCSCCLRALALAPPSPGPCFLQIPAWFAPSPPFGSAQSLITPLKLHTLPQAFPPLLLLCFYPQPLQTHSIKISPREWTLQSTGILSILCTPLTLVLWKRSDKSPWHPWVFPTSHSSCFLVALTVPRREQWNLSNAKALYVLGVGENNKKSGEESGEILSYFWAIVGKRGTSQTESALGKMKRKSPEGCSV